jgi:1-phosphatidylinositol-3-phosphate 5-kinase
LVVAADKVTFDPDAKTKPEWAPDERANKLRLMGFEVQRHQLDLDAAISQIPSSRLNDARTLIAAHHKSMEQMFTSYLKENKIPGSLNDAPFALPGYIQGDTHALPGGSLLLREDDPSSIIAYTLSYVLI